VARQNLNLETLRWLTRQEDLNLKEGACRTIVIKMQLHNLLTSTRNEEAIIKSNSTQLANVRSMKKKVKSASFGAGNILKEIQMMIISQEI